MARGIQDPSLSCDVTVDGEAIHLLMHFQDAERPDAAAKVDVEMGGIEALKLATELVSSARQLGADTVTYGEALLRAQHRATHSEALRCPEHRTPAFADEEIAERIAAWILRGDRWADGEVIAAAIRRGDWKAR